jgi:cytochrome c oxidase subunit 2
MHINQKKLDSIYVILLLVVIVGLPLGIKAYDNYLWQDKLPPNDKEFTLTGHTNKGWIIGDVQAFDVIPLSLSKLPREKPVIEVSKGDRVVLKLKSSDVVHGFSLKDFGVFITDGIQPGKTMLISFIADKTGSFTFSCNAICGDNHKNMQGTLTVSV